MNTSTRQAGEEKAGSGLGMAAVSSLEVSRSERTLLAMRLLSALLGIVVAATRLGDMGEASGASQHPQGSDRPAIAEPAPERDESGPARPGLVEGAGVDPSESVVASNGDLFLTVQVPPAWSDQRTDVWTIDDEPVGLMLVASPDAEAFLSGYHAPGVMFAASRRLAEEYDDPAQLLDDLGTSVGTSGCKYDNRIAYDDGYYKGVLDGWTDCGADDAVIFTIAAEPPDGSVMIEVLIQLVSQADEDAAWTIVRSFVVE